MCNLVVSMHKSQMDSYEEEESYESEIEGNSHPVLKSDRAETKAWLLKLPKHVHNKWSELYSEFREQQPYPGVRPLEVGRLRVHRTRKGDKFSLLLPDPVTEETFPRVCSVKLSENPQQYLVFSRNREDTEFMVEGNASIQCHVEPPLTVKRLSAVKRENFEEEEHMPFTVLHNPVRTVESVYRGRAALELRSTQERKREKRDRIDRTDLEKWLFEIFAKHPRCTREQLERMTRQPRAYLSSVLLKLCTLHSSGYYELKEEYKM